MFYILFSTKIFLMNFSFLKLFYTINIFSCVTHTNRYVRRSKSSCSTGMTPQEMLLENSTAFGDFNPSGQIVFRYGISTSVRE